MGAPQLIIRRLLINRIKTSGGCASCTPCATHPLSLAVGEVVEVQQAASLLTLLPLALLRSGRGRPQVLLLLLLLHRRRPSAEL